MKRARGFFHIPLLVLVVGLLSIPAGVWAQVDASFSDKPPVIRVGLYDNPPKIYRDKQDQPSGLFIDLLENIAKNEGWQLDYVDCTWNSCLEKLESGDLDLMPDVAGTTARGQRFDFHTIPVVHSWSSLWSNKEIEISGWMDLKGKRIAILSGAVQEDALKRILKGFAIPFEEIPVNSMAAGFEAVVSGDADVTVANSFFGGIYGPRYGLRESPVIFEPSSLFYAAPKGRHAALLSRIDDYLSQWRSEEGSIYYQALKQAMSRPQGPVLPRQWLRALIIGAVLLLLLLILTALLRWQVRRKTSELRRINQRFEYLQQASPVVLFHLALPLGRAPKALWVSDNITRVFGFIPHETYEPGWWQSVVHQGDLQQIEANMRSLPEKGHSSIEYRLYDNDGSLRYVREELQFFPATADNPAHVVGSWSDITTTREQQDQLSFLTHYDPLTQLPNRTLLHLQLQDALKHLEAPQEQLALLSLDLDHFKKINETFGFDFGDKILRQTAGRLKHLLRLEDSIARMGADEFVIIIQGENIAELASSIGRRILHRLGTPLHVDSQELIVTTSVGISLFPADGDDSATLLKNAEIARYAAKRQGRNRLHFFSSQLSDNVRENLVMESALRNSIERGELVLHYQPQFDLKSGNLVGVEALVRWQRPEIGLVPPGLFIPLAEEIGLINDIGLWVLEEACRQTIAWDRQGYHVPRIAVNLAVQQIESGHLPQQVMQILQHTGLPAQRLELEVTESAIMIEPKKAAEALLEFQAMGIRLAIDDFGTGYSSLAYLKKLPLDRLKIDRSFVMDLGSNAGDDIISRAIINLSKSLGMETVAEGIEHNDQLEFLRQEGCEIGQGYLFSKPLPADELMAFMDKNPAKPS